MTSVSELRIPKNEIRVEIRLRNGAEVDDYFLYLNQCSPFHNGPETLDEFLNATLAFIPVRHAASSELMLFNLSSILFVHEKEPCEESGEKTICLQFCNQLELEVKHFELLPAFHSRPIDFFNLAQPFLTFLHGGRKVYVNKSNVSRVNGL